MYGYIHVKNFRCFDDEFISFRDSRNRILTEVHFIGENSSGKSSILSLFSFIKELTFLNYYDEITMKNESIKKCSFYKVNSMNKIVAEHRNYFSNNGLEINFEVVLENTKYYYEIRFNDNNDLIFESLEKISSGNKTTLFERDKNSYKSSKGVIRVKNKDDFDKCFNENKSNYSLLAMIFNKTYKNEYETISEIKELCTFISMHHVNNDHHKHYNFNSYDKKYYQSISGGMASLEVINEMELFIPILKDTLRQISCEVSDIKYAIEKLPNELYGYHLLIEHTRNGKSIWLSKKEWPNSYNQSIDILNAVNDSRLTGTIVWDNIIDKLHYNTTRNIINEFNKHSKGQIIVSSNSSKFLNDVDPNSIFLLAYDNNKYKVKKIVGDFSYRTEHNIKNRYEKGLYETKNTKDN